MATMTNKRVSSIVFRVKPTKKKKRNDSRETFQDVTFSLEFRKKRRNWNEERRMNAETFGLKYRPVQQNNNQRSSSRRNPTRYQRSGNARNTMYYGNFNNRVRAY